MCKFPIYLHSIRSSVSHFGQVPYLFTFHYIFSFPLCASSLTSYVSLYLQCPILGKYPIVLRFIISSVSHYVQVLHIFTFHSIFSVPFCASSLTSYVSLYLQCPILGKYPIILCFIIYLVSHYVQVPYLFTFHQIFSVPLCASSPFFTISLYLQCPILGKFPIYLHSIRSSVSHFGQVPYLFTFHYIFSVPFGASSLSIYIPLDLQCPIMCMFPIFLPFIISLVIMCKFPNFLCFVISSVSHSGQVPYLFTLHYIFSVPFWASSLSIYISSVLSTQYFVLQCPIMGKYPIILCFHYIFSVPLCASSLSIYISLDLQCPIMCKFSIFLHFIISLVSSSLYLQCPILGKFPIYLHSIRSSVSHYVQVLLSFYISLYLQCPILGKFPIYVSFTSVPILGINFFSVPLCASSLSFTFHYILVSHLCASSLQFHYVSLYYSVSHYVQVPSLSLFPFVPLHSHFIYLVSHYMCKFPIFFTFHSLYLQCPILGKYLFTPLDLQCPIMCKFSILFTIPLYLQCPILGKFPIYLHFIISSVSHYVQVLLFLHFIISLVSHYVASSPIFYIPLLFSVPLCACSLSFYLSLYLQFPIMCKFPNFLCFVISSVSHSGQVPYSFTFHYIFSVPLCASSPYFYISFIFSVPLCASSLSSYIPLYLQCPILGKYPIILCFIIYLVSHYVQVPYLFTFHYFLCVPLCASSPSFYLSLYVQCPIMCKFPNFLCFVISCPMSGQVCHYIFSVPLCASSLSFYLSLYLQFPISSLTS